jgi:hypothetical protein
MIFGSGQVKNKKKKKNKKWRKRMGNTSLVGLSMCERIFRKNEINSRKEKRINKKENWAPKNITRTKKRKRVPEFKKRKEIQTDRRTEREEKEKNVDVLHVRRLLSNWRGEPAPRLLGSPPFFMFSVGSREVVSACFAT